MTRKVTFGSLPNVFKQLQYWCHNKTRGTELLNLAEKKVNRAALSYGYFFLKNNRTGTPVREKLALNWFSR